MASSVFLLLLLLLSQAASDSNVLRHHRGDDVTLPCEVADAAIVAVEWTRPDLSPKYVLFYRDGRSDTTHQLSSFEGRVQLVNGEPKDGDVSLILRNVTRGDDGTYECRVARRNGSRRRRAVIGGEPVRSVTLEVTEPGSQSENHGNHPRQYTGLVAAFVLVCFTVGFFVGVNYERHVKKSEPSGDV